MRTVEELEARLEVATRERNEARAEVEMLRERVVEHQRKFEAGWAVLCKERDEARAVNIGPVLHENEQLRSHARAVSNLLAIIHGDGGHYEGKHGTVKACKDAEGVVSNLRLKLDAATYKLSGCQCQWEAGDSPCPVHGDDEK